MFTLNKPIIYLVNLSGRFCHLLFAKEAEDQKGHVVCLVS